MIQKYTVEYLTKNMSGDWSKLNNPSLGFPDMYELTVSNYRILKK